MALLFISHNKSYTWFIPRKFSRGYLSCDYILIFYCLLIQLYVIIEYLLCCVILIYFGRLNHSSISSLMLYVCVYRHMFHLCGFLAHRIDNGTIVDKPHLSENGAMLEIWGLQVFLWKLFLSPLCTANFRSWADLVFWGLHVFELNPQVTSSMYSH